MSFESDLESLGIDSPSESAQEGSFKTAEDQQPAPEASGAQTSSLMQAMRGGAPEDQPPTDGPRKVPIQTVITFGLLIVGAGALYGMRQYAINNGMSNTIIGGPVNTNIQHDVKPLSPEQERVLADLRTLATEEGKVGEAISKNPFKLGETERVQPVEPKDDPNAAVEAARREVKRVVDGLAAKSIMMGRVPLVKINNDIYKTGQVIQDVLEVARIEDRSVTLRVINKGEGIDGEEFILHLER
jgi:hypothetical protein